MTLALRAIADLRWLASYWPDLEDSRLQGTPAPWRRPELTAEEREERDQQAWQERLERTGDAPGATPAPVRVAVLDTLTDLLADAVDLADELAAAVSCPALPPPSTGLADARPYLEFAAARLGEVTRDVDLGAWAFGRTRAMVATTARALALLFDGQRLDVVCPWCEGRTPETPAGGARTWRVKDLFGNRDCKHGQPDRRFCDQCDQMVVIVCMGVCEPESRFVGTWWHGQPCWPVTEWDWLAQRVSEAASA